MTRPDPLPTYNLGLMGKLLIIYLGNDAKNALPMVSSLIE
jgi:hypothetical protein